MKNDYVQFSTITKEAAIMLKYQLYSGLVDESDDYKKALNIWL